jgi:hypothetical protein
LLHSKATDGFSCSWLLAAYGRATPTVRLSSDNGGCRKRLVVCASFLSLVSLASFGVGVGHNHDQPLFVEPKQYSRIYII